MELDVHEELASETRKPSFSFGHSESSKIIARHPNFEAIQISVQILHFTISYPVWGHLVFYSR